MERGREKGGGRKRMGCNVRESEGWREMQRESGLRSVALLLTIDGGLRPTLTRLARRCTSRYISHAKCGDLMSILSSFL